MSSDLKTALEHLVVILINALVIWLMHRGRSRRHKTVQRGRGEAAQGPRYHNAGPE